MLTLTLGIHGMAYLVERNNGEDVILGSRDGHQPLLTIPTRFLNPTATANRWDPDYISFTPVIMGGMVHFEQIALWDLSQREASIGPRKKCTWGNRAEAICFDDKDLHDKKSGTFDASPGCAIVTLGDFKLTSEHPLVFGFETDEKEPFELERATHIMGTVETSGCTIEIFSGNKVIVVRNVEKTGEQPAIAISNLAVEPIQSEALKHFAAYYLDAAGNEQKKPIPEEQRFRISAQSSDVYDCIPPTTGP